MNSILITGCNRGLGLGIVKELIKLSKPPKYIFATCRDVKKAEELSNISQNHQNVKIIQIDLNNFNEYDRLVQTVADTVKNEGLNVLFNNAGISPKSTRINFVKVEDLMDTFKTNTVAPIMLTKAFIPLLKKAALVNENAPLGVGKAAIINMSSILGSIEANVEGGLYAYRASKTALNAATKSMSIDLKDNKILCVSLHPGWVKTDLGGSKAPLDIETSCHKMIKTILNMNENHNGGFYRYDGKKLNW